MTCWIRKRERGEVGERRIMRRIIRGRSREHGEREEKGKRKGDWEKE